MCVYVGYVGHSLKVSFSTVAKFEGISAKEKKYLRERKRERGVVVEGRWEGEEKRVGGTGGRER